MTIALRPVADGDASWLDGWLAPVAASVGYIELDGARPGASLLERTRGTRATNSTKGTKGTKGTKDEGMGMPGRDVRARIIVRDGSDAGVAVYRLDAPKRGSAIIEIVAMQPALARRGSGMMAAAQIEEELRRDGVRSLYAPAPAAHGIAVYFWIRLGYRPLLRAAWPCARDGVAWLVRESCEGQ